MGRPKTDPNIRFWKMVVKQRSGCWLFISKKGGRRNKYGLFWNGETEEIPSRFSYRTEIGKIPDGLFVLHTCDNPRCVNPKHLWLGTAEDNRQDMINKRRHAHGESGARKLTADNVVYIRKLYESGNVSQQNLADKFGVNQTLISAIVRKATWKILNRMY